MKTESSEDNCESVEDMDNCCQCYGIALSDAMALVCVRELREKILESDAEGG